MFQHPFNLIVSGASGSGKTEWVLKFLKHSDALIEPPPRKILYCFGEANQTVIKLRNDGIETHHGIPNEDLVKQYDMVILDDLALHINNNDFLDRLFTVGSHHWGVSVVFITQSLFSKDVRIARQNAHYVLLCKNPQQLLQTRTLASQLFPKRLGYFLEAYHDATSEPFGYLLINMHPNANEDMRLSTRIFPGEKTTIYLPI